MNKKTTGKASAAKSKRKTSVISAQSSVKAMEKRLALMGYVRGRDWSMELIEALQKTEQELVDCSALLKTLSAHSSQETVVMECLRELEIKRFQLLGQVHGNRVNDYHLLIS